MSLIDVLLQSLFLAAALAVIAYQVWRGWQRGFGRQIFNLLALASAYVTAVCSGELALPIFRVLGYPDFVIRMTVGLTMALLVFFGVREIGRILHRDRLRRGLAPSHPKWRDAGGAVLGGVFALTALWIAVIGLRLMGTVAETEISRQEVMTPREKAAPEAIGKTSQNVMTGLATLKRSIEVGPAGEMVKRADPLPSGLYSSLRKLAQLMAQPERAELFLSYPGAQELIAHPRLVALQRDPGITRSLEQGNFFGLLRNPEVVAAANDPELRQMLGKFALEEALDFALEEEQPGLLPIGEQR